jgi:hypothetical protein
VAFLTPGALLGALLALPILLMYMLRLRRREQVISSTFLWQRVLQDREANTPWQRLRRNLLLLLQLLILALLVLSLMRPFITVPAISAGRVVLVLDASASMSATDGGEGRTRFEAAQAAALDVLSALPSDSEVAVLRAGQSPELLISYTLDHQAAAQAVRSARPSAGQTDWLGALTVAAAGATGQADFALILLTDGGVTGLESFNRALIRGSVRVIAVGSAADNIALTALAVRALPSGGGRQLFAEISNTGVSDAEVVFTLRADDDPVPLASERYSIPAGASLPIISTADLPPDVTALTASITPTVNSVSRDLLSLDNSASVVLGTVQPLNVLLVSEGNLFLEQVLSLLPTVRAFRALPDRALPAQPFDLVIFDRTVPTALPASGDLLFIAPPAGVAGWFEVGATDVPGTSRLLGANDARLTDVSLTPISVRSYKALSGVEWAAPLVATADGAPLLVAGEQAGRKGAVLAFALSDSDLPLDIAFPILMANLMEWYRPAGVVAEPALRAGQSQTLRPPLNADAMRVIRPDGGARDVPILGREVVYPDTGQLGVYTVEALRGGQVVSSERFAVNLFSPAESSIAPRTVSISGQLVQTTAPEEETRLELWPWVAVLALLVLLVEWRAYHRRQRPPEWQMPAAQRPSRPQIRASR